MMGMGFLCQGNIKRSKGSISAALEGFQKTDGSNGVDIYRVRGWDYAALCEVFEKGIQRVREKHIPAVFHVEELTQPQGHSTSGSHERYKSAERLAWEKEWDCISQMRGWLIENALATEEDLEKIEKESHETVVAARIRAFKQFQAPIKEQVKSVIAHCNVLIKEAKNDNAHIKKVAKNFIGE
jgi:TPP-dependent pyruvate/acetoin dehydrogenase alpha subunit